MGCGRFRKTDPLSLRWLGHAWNGLRELGVNGEYELRKALAIRCARIARERICAACVCVSMIADGKVEKFCEGGTIVHIDIDPSEINKN